MSLVLKSFIKELIDFSVNRFFYESDLRFVLFKGQASRPYRRMGRHLVLINAKTTSSDAVLPIVCVGLISTPLYWSDVTLMPVSNLYDLCVAYINFMYRLIVSLCFCG